MKRLLRVALMIAMTTPSMGLAQTPTASPETSIVSRSLVPKPDELGDGWSVRLNHRININGAAIRDAREALLMGPAGSSVLVIIMLPDLVASSLPAAWSDGTTTFDRARTFYSPSESMGQALPASPPPSWASDTLRASFLSYQTQQVTGIGLYGVASDYLVLVVVIGAIPITNGLQLTGDAAADYVAAIVNQKIAA